MLQTMIPYGKHYLDEDDIAAVTEVLRSGWITQGPKIPELESVVASYVESKFAVAVSSGTTALHLAYLAAGLDAESKVVTSNNTFVASANCVRYGGGTPIFCDIDPHTLNLSPDCFEEIVRNEPNINGVIPVHFGGVPCDMEAISELAKKNGISVIEDASHAFGATYRDGSKVGNCKFSVMTVFSLHPVKGVTAGEGGIITTNSEEIYDHLLSLRSHGICKGNFDIPGISEPGDDLIYQEEAIEDGKLNPWYYEMQELGYNYRITDIQCALVLSQLNKLDRFLERRREIANLYDNLLEGVKHLTLTQTGSREFSSNHIYVIRIDYQAIGKSRAQVMRLLSAKGIGTQVHYIPVTRHPYYNNLGYDSSHYPESEKYYRQALTIPLYYGLTNEEVEDVVISLKEVLTQN
jgi:UDP-4-amino-4,6-dideoxy-N-acetyl-beta-L-altrosamine transaminase